jgi:hypothetical protein
VSAFNEVMSNLKTSSLFRIDTEPDIRSLGGVTTFTVKMFRPEEEKSTDENAET